MNWFGKFAGIFFLVIFATAVVASIVWDKPRVTGALTPPVSLEQPIWTEYEGTLPEGTSVSISEVRYQDNHPWLIVQLEELDGEILIGHVTLQGAEGLSWTFVEIFGGDAYVPALPPETGWELIPPQEREMDEGEEVPEPVMATASAIELEQIQLWIAEMEAAVRAIYNIGHLKG